MSVQNPDWLKGVLSKQTFQKYHAFYRTFRHNHKAHGIVAIARLGGSEELMNKYVAASEPMVKRLDRGEALTDRIEIDDLKSDNIDDYLGKNQGFYKIFDHFTKLYKEKYNGDIVKFVKDVYPSMIDGPLFGAFHGLIQMGYGFAAGSDDMAIEGIALSFQQYSPLYFYDNNSKRTDLSLFGKGQVDLLDKLTSLIESDMAKSYGEQRKKDRKWLMENNFIVYGYTAIKHHSDFFMDAVNDVKLPDWFQPEKKDMEQLSKLITWVMDMATVAYVKSNDANNFFKLHGVTGSWSARWVLPLVDFDTALLGLHGILAGLLVVYVEEKAALDKTPDDYFTGDVTQERWNELIKEVLENPVFYDVHIYKTVQCLYERWLENPDGEYARYYFAGACATKDNAFANLSGNKMGDEA